MFLSLFLVQPFRLKLDFVFIWCCVLYSNCLHDLIVQYDVGFVYLFMFFFLFSTHFTCIALVVQWATEFMYIKRYNDRENSTPTHTQHAHIQSHIVKIVSKLHVSVFCDTEAYRKERKRDEIRIVCIWTLCVCLHMRCRSVI